MRKWRFLFSLGSYRSPLGRSKYHYFKRACYKRFPMNLAEFSRASILYIYSTKPELRFCAGSNPVHGVLEIHDGEDLWQWSRLEIRLNVFRWWTIPQKQFNIIIWTHTCVKWSNEKIFSHKYIHRKIPMIVLFEVQL